MLEVETPTDLLRHVGRELGPTEWLTVDQGMIDTFAHATGDHQWIHVDVERARREMPGGTTIAHGYLTLSLVPRLAAPPPPGPPPRRAPGGPRGPPPTSPPASPAPGTRRGPSRPAPPWWRSWRRTRATST